MTPLLAVTIGDPGGIGPEIILKLLPEFRASGARVCLFGTRAVFQKAAESCGIVCDPQDIQALRDGGIGDGEVGLLDISKLADEIISRQGGAGGVEDGPCDMATVSLRNAAIATAALRAAAEGAKLGEVSAMVTAPIHKSAMRLIDPAFQGHTEFLTQAAGSPETAMMFVSEKLKVTLATIHLPLRRVAGVLRQDSIFQKIKLTDQFLRTRFMMTKPRLAVAALNPHGSEFGGEEDRVIEPAIRQAAQAGIAASGPYPCDQVFYDAYHGRFDAVIAMYHDQGLAPFKLVAFDTGVNVTLGLPYIRTSPDHGTGFDIAYQNKANPSALGEAFRLAVRWAA
jgi:4-hydroxythreonine-4-phosphate dehydrogenase